MVVPPYPEKVAATPCRGVPAPPLHNLQVVRVSHFVGLSQRLKENTLLATAPADSAETFTVSYGAPLALVP
jgi:hypothetical protein